MKDMTHIGTPLSILARVLTVVFNQTRPVARLAGKDLQQVQISVTAGPG